MTGFGEAFARYDAELDAAVSRARQVAAEARADSARFRAETARQAELARDRATPADGPGARQLREQATEFRRGQGLPAPDLPPEQPPAAPAPAEDDDFSQEQILSTDQVRDQPPGPQPEQPPESQPEQPPEQPPVHAVRQPPRPRPGRGARPVPRSDDEDEDFSQERILFDG